MTDGAIDNEFDDAEASPAEQLAKSFEEAVGDVPTHRSLAPGDLAFDLVTRQLLYIADVSAESVVDYYDDEEFDLASYKGHPWLPVRSDDRVFACVFVPTTAEGLHKGGNDYDYPAGRLARVPMELWPGVENRLGNAEPNTVPDDAERDTDGQATLDGAGDGG
jgi:hypothetical protein